MKRLKIIGIFLIVMFYPLSVLAQQNKGKEIPPWMEDIKIKGRSTYLVPKGATHKIIGAQIVVEPPSEYVARRIYEMEAQMEEHFNKITKDQEEIKKEIQELKAVFLGTDLKKELNALKESIEKIEQKKEEEAERKLEALKEAIQKMELERESEEGTEEVFP